MAVTIPSHASVELLKRTGVEPGQLGPNATPGRALTEAFQEKLTALRQSAQGAQGGAQGAQGAQQGTQGANTPSVGATGSPTGSGSIPQAPQAPQASGRINPPSQSAPQARALNPIQTDTKGDKVLHAFFQNRGEVPRGGVSLRVRAESALATNPAGGVASPQMANTLRTQAFLQEAAVGTQAARRGPAGLEEGFRTLAQGGGGGS